MGETQRVLCCFQLEPLFLKYKLAVTVSMREKGGSMVHVGYLDREVE